jgi:hypothetical protein
MTIPPECEAQILRYFHVEKWPPTTIARQLAFEALDNGILSCAEPERLQTICDGLSAAKIDALLRKWLRLLPHPFTAADRKAGYRYDISILQAEFSTTQVLDRPAHGRVFFEQVIRENLDLGRPEEIKLIFNRRIPRNTRARFCTRVVTHGVTPSLNIHYKNTRIKQYHKENRALPTETTINNTYDFGIGKRLHNLPKLRKIGFAANRRLIEIERLSHDCILSEDTFQAINRGCYPIEVSRACIRLILEHPFDAIIVPQCLARARQDVALFEMAADGDKPVLAAREHLEDGTEDCRLLLIDDERGR